MVDQIHPDRYFKNGIPDLFRLRLSLALAFLLLTFLTMLIGIRGFEARQQRMVVRQLQAMGGIARYDYQFSNGRCDPKALSPYPRYLIDKLGVDFFHRAVEVAMQPNGIAAWPDLAKLPYLHSLIIRSMPVTDEHLHQLQSNHRLKYLYISDARNVTDSGLHSLAKISALRHVHISNSQVTDFGIAALRRLNLQSLSLQFNQISDSGVAHLSQMRELRSLWLCGSEHCPNQITDLGIQALASLHELKELGLQHSFVTSAGVYRLQRMLPDCSVIGVRTL